ncbi:MAG: helix-turn-helix domain-containing protein [Candidatus Omnitrophica bacterium]|nr:helix-turn-helix domain-containing protein [Candidatus Omnitrophota bacterium]
MPEKLLTLQELSLYLGIKESKIMKMVDSGVVSAYHLGGEYLRFRKDQIDAISAEINTKVSETDRISVQEIRSKLTGRRQTKSGMRKNSFFDSVADFFYFYDFYLISFALISALLIVIIKY